LSIAAASLLVVLLGVVAVVFFRGEKVAEAINEDVRVPLWEGASAMALAHPVVGVGQPEYESSYSAYVPLSRFLRSKYYTTRSDHPHNHFLYLAGAFGFAGLFAIVLLSLAPLVVCATRFRSLGTISKLCFFAYTALLTHSMFDLVASRWPTDMVFLLTQGVLLGDAVALLASRSSTGAGVRGRVPRWVLQLELTALALSLACVVGVVLVDLESSRLRWIGKTLYDVGEVPAAFHAYGESISVSPDPTTAYDAGIFSLLYFQDPYLGLKYFSILEKLPDRILSHANSHMADCMLRLGRRRDALHYLDEESVAQPTSLVALRNKLVLERALGFDVAAERTAERLIAILKFKGMKLKDLGRVLRNPDLDGHFYKLKTRERRN
jgi:tetratricopeptide (TPR) repeat protein